jgi:hypothetical protein
MAPPNKRWTARLDDQLRALNAGGVSLNEAARQLGFASSTVSDHGVKLGLSWDRVKVAAANEARRQDAAARRLQLELDLLDDAQHLRGRLREPLVYFDWGGKDHDYAEKEVDQPTPTDQLKLIQAVGAAIDRSLKIAQHETGVGTEGAKSLLGDLAAALGIDTSPPDDPPTPAETAAP